VNSITEEKKRNSGNEEEDEKHVNKEVHNSCTFLEAIHMVCTL
jgi:hypothetical protein